MPITVPTMAYLIAGSPARNHDFDFARIRLHQALYDAGDIRTDVANNYDDGKAIREHEMLVTYTSQVPVADENCQALRDFLENGGRWFAIHASNSVLQNPHLPGILGSRFLAHPPYMGYDVSVTKTFDPLVQGLPSNFAVEDELYVVEECDDIEVLLNTNWGGDAMGKQYPDHVRPLMYRRPVGRGGVLYLALGHANRPFDKPRPDMDDRPDHRGPWDLPVYKELIKRGIDWAAGRRPFS
ncbi:MAG: ThuA domain-containing protein [Chloroflexi bacterium]|nr:ThuA domain-containing protein [Chloroflexota bacterium]